MARGNIVTMGILLILVRLFYHGSTKDAFNYAIIKKLEKHYLFLKEKCFPPFDVLVDCHLFYL